MYIKVRGRRINTSGCQSAGQRVGAVITCQVESAGRCRRGGGAAADEVMDRLMDVPGRLTRSDKTPTTAAFEVFFFFFFSAELISG